VATPTTPASIEGETAQRPAIDTALDSVRRSKNNAKRMRDGELVAILTRCEAALLTLEAKRAEQGVLALGGGAADAT
jgi:hypothetical protein